jgi:hypothetical protein
VKLLHRLIALIMARFWAQCPVCKRHFGGHQEHHKGVELKGKHYRIACGKCVKRLT